MPNDMKFKINVRDFVKDFDSLGEDVVSDMNDKVKEFSKAVYNEALRLSSMKLNVSAIDWQNNLRYEQLGNNIYVIYLVSDSSAEDFETGFAGYDMKPGFLNGPKSKKTKDGKGRYLDIPIPQHPSSKRGASKTVIDMRSAVASVLKDKTVDKRIKEYNAKSSGLERYGKITKYVNTPDPRVEGLIKVQPPKKGGSRYYIFRRVSNKSSGDKWIHPGYNGVNIFTELEKYTIKGIEDIIKGTIG